MKGSYPVAALHSLLPKNSCCMKRIFASGMRISTTEKRQNPLLRLMIGKEDFLSPNGHRPHVMCYYMCRRSFASLFKPAQRPTAVT